MRGYVYVLDFGDRGVKIGRSKNPEKRIRSIETQSGSAAIDRWVSSKMIRYGDLEAFLLREFRSRDRSKVTEQKPRSRGIGEYVNQSFDDVVSFAKCKECDFLSHGESDDACDIEAKRRLEYLEDMIFSSRATDRKLYVDVDQYGEPVVDDAFFARLDESLEKMEKYARGS